ncbi:hypothetical protein [Hydrogenivirga sp.]
MGIRLMGVYRDNKRVGYEIFFGMQARFFPPKEDLVNLHRNILLVKNRQDGFLLFLNVNLQTLIEERERLKELFQESEDIPFIAVLELRMDEVKERLKENSEELERLLNDVRHTFPAPLSFSGVGVNVEDYELLKRFTPDYAKIPMKELGCLRRETIEGVVVMLEEATRSTVVFTHVETEEEFRKVPPEAMWLGFYEERMLKTDSGYL